MDLSKFLQKYLGKKVDYDGHNGPQCMDLYRLYCDEFLQIPQSPALGMNGGAKDLIDNPGVLKVMREFSGAEYNPGDILVWGASDKNPYGHVAILVSILNTKFFVVAEQDGFRQDGAKLALRSRDNLLGGLYKA